MFLLSSRSHKLFFTQQNSGVWQLQLEINVLLSTNIIFPQAQVAYLCIFEGSCSAPSGEAPKKEYNGFIRNPEGNTSVHGCVALLHMPQELAFHFQYIFRCYGSEISWLKYV